MQHVQWLRRLAHSLVADPGAADDLSQETWVVALEQPPPGDRPLRGWLAGVLRNRVRLRVRSERRRREREREAAQREALPSTLELLQRLSMQKALVVHVEALDEPYRTTILLRYLEDLRPADIAARQGVPLATVKTRLQRGLERLRARLDADQRGERGAWMAALVPLAHAPVGSLPLAAPLAPAAATGALMMSAKIPVALLVAVAAVAAGTLWFRGAGEPVKPARAANPQSSRLATLAPAAAEAIDAPRAPAPRRSLDAPSPVAAAVAEPAAAPRYALRGRVIDLRSAAVAGIAVRLESREGAELARAVTDADGAFAMTSAQAPGPSKLRASDERYTTVLAAVTWGEADAERTVVVAPRGPLAGIVVDASDRGLPDAEVKLVLPRDLRSRFDAILDLSEDGSWHTTSDPSGAFALPDAPQVTGTWLVVDKQGFAPEVQAAEGPDLALRIVLGAPSHEQPMISGRVLDPLGVPVAGAHVALGYADERTDAEGRFTLDIRHGEQQEGANTLRAIHPGYQPAELVKDAETGWPESCELRFPGMALAISGRVLSSEGEPLAGIEVRLAQKTEFGAVRRDPKAEHSTRGFIEDLAAGAAEHADGVRTDASGRFTLGGLLPQPYTLEAFDPRDLATARAEQVEAGARGVDIRLHAYERSPVAGRVLALDGTPIAGAHVRPFLAPEGFSGGERGSFAALRFGPTATTDAEGAFRFEALATERLGLQVYGVTILSMQFWPVPPGSDLQALEVRLPRRCHFQVELVSQPDLGERFEILDAAGQRLPLHESLGNYVIYHEDVRLSSGRSPVLSVDETASTLVLYSGTAEVLRMPIKLSASEIETIEL